MDSEMFFMEDSRFSSYLSKASSRRSELMFIFLRSFLIFSMTKRRSSGCRRSHFSLNF